MYPILSSYRHQTPEPLNRIGFLLMEISFQFQPYGVYRSSLVLHLNVNWKAHKIFFSERAQCLSPNGLRSFITLIVDFRALYRAMPSGARCTTAHLNWRSCNVSVTPKTTSTTYPTTIFDSCRVPATSILDLFWKWLQFGLVYAPKHPVMNIMWLLHYVCDFCERVSVHCVVLEAGH